MSPNILRLSYLPKIDNKYPKQRRGKFFILNNINKLVFILFFTDLLFDRLAWATLSDF